MMKILMLTSESVPWAKTGGLADAVPALAAALAGEGHDVRILMPRYYRIDRTGLEKAEQPLGVPMGPGEMWCAVYRTTVPGSGVRVYFLDREDLYGRDGIYGPDGGSSWPDNALRYAFLSASAFQLCRSLAWVPDILHMHDWQAAPAAWLLKYGERYRDFAGTASVLTVHNLGYQGVFSAADLGRFPLDRVNGIVGPMIRGDAVNFLAGGLNCSDRITTVSPTYAGEILNEEFSEGLGDILGGHSDRLTGILNGMDYGDWNPATDPALGDYRYDTDDISGKAGIKAVLQKEMNLPADPHMPLFGMITRLTGQKGVDLLIDPDGPAMKVFRDGRAQLAVLGTGEPRYEKAMSDLARKFPGNCAVRIAFSGPLSRRIEAGSDFFLMPSRYEPCGLNQMYSLRYGTLPIVRRTGGLADTVTDLTEHPRTGNGFVFGDANSAALAEAINRAAAFYGKAPSMSAARRRAMKLRFDWTHSARSYLDVYRAALKSVQHRI